MTRSTKSLGLALLLMLSLLTFREATRITTEVREGRIARAVEALPGRVLRSSDSRVLCCSKGAALETDGKAAVIWYLRATDCTSCSANEMGYWRRLAATCNSGVSVFLVTSAADSAEVGAFARRFRFPGLLSLAGVGAIGTITLPPPMWFLVDSSGVVLLASSASPARLPFASRVKQISGLGGSCSNSNSAQSSTENSE